jgi:dolichyl-phosphate-mannose-protein mannosyltransferase
MDNGTQARTKIVCYFFLLLTVSVSILLLAARIHEGFDPSDDPVLAHAAERVLHGERPHVDFRDVYTGALSYLDAASFRIFGTNLLAPRIMLLIFFAPAVAAIWYAASRMLRPAAASMVTLLAVVWSVPLYPSPIASWYLLYFAIFATAALFGYLENRKRRWVFAAGVFAGIAILFKITGIYLVAAGMLFLLFDEQSDPIAKGQRRLSAMSVAVTGLLLLFCGALVLLVRSHAGPAEYYHFVLPGTALSALLIYREWHSEAMPSVSRTRGIAGRLLPFLAGVSTPIAAFLVPYIAARQVGPLLQDVLIAPFTRLHSTYWAPIGPIAALLSLPIFELIAINAALRNEASRRIAMAGSCIGCGLALYLSLRYPYFAFLTWLSAAASIPLLSVIAAVSLSRLASGGKNTSRLLLLVAMTAMCSLNQFPFSAPIYFCYVAPLLILAMAALVAVRPYAGPSIVAPVAAFFLVFAVAVLMQNQIYSKGLTLRPDVLKAFAIPRAGGIRGSTAIVDRYQRVCTEITAHGAGPIYAGPDSSGLYFLTGRENATPILWEFLAGEDARPDRVLADIDRAGVNVVVINHSTQENYSGPMPSELLSALQSRFPESKMIDYFEIRWK